MGLTHQAYQKTNPYCCFTRVFIVRERAQPTECKNLIFNNNVNAG